MYTINFTGTGSATFDNFTETEKSQILYVLNNVVSNYDEKTSDNSKVRYIGDGFYIIKINNSIRVGIKIQNKTFKIIEVYRYIKNENLVAA